MTNRYNPFRPNSPVYTGMFAGRLKEIERIDQVLFQTKLSNPTYLLIIGERGIGKSSLLLVGNLFSKGKLTWTDNKYNFFTVQISIGKDTTFLDLARKINAGISREFDKTEPGLAFLKKSWEFLQKWECAGVKFSSGKDNVGESEIIDSLSYSIADTVKAITKPTAISELGLREQKDGIVILIDEADNAASELNLGGFLKNLSEILVKEGCNKVMVILAGLPRLRDILRESHESSLRLFEEYELAPLSPEEVKHVIKKGLEEAIQQSSIQTSITDDALDHIIFYSEGYPHFVQQIGASVFSIDVDNVITVEDVKKGMLMPNGALDLIGDKYYKDIYYNRIEAESYRQILKIMAQKWNDWISKKEIEEKFKGKPTALINGLKALRDRNIILSKSGTKGLYRLQWKSFAFWIKTFTEHQANGTV